MNEIKPTVLFVLHMPPPVHGAAMMGKYIHDSSLVNGSLDCHYINLATAKDLADIGKVGIGKIKQFCQLLTRIRREVKKLRPQLVYMTPNARGGAFYKDFIVVQMLKSMGCKVVVHYHNKGVATRQERWMDNLLYRKFFKGIKVILLAEKLYEDIRKYVPWENVCICANGIPPSRTGMKTVLEKKKPEILFLSNLLIEKGVLELLDACKILKEKKYIFRCNFVGGESAEINASRFQEEVKRRGLEGIAIYHGKKFGNEKLPFFQSADMFILPTYYHNECFPLVLLEAMEQGVACIASNEGGIADIVEEGKTGFIIEKKNAGQLAEKIELLLNNRSLCREMGKAGREKFLQNFTLDKFEEQMVKILRQVL